MNRNIVLTLLLILAIASVSCAANNEPAPIQRALAFPGADGFGKYASGGRGGRVIKVTNLEDSGPGSLRQAIISRGPRMVVFEISGIIDLEGPIDINRGDLTIAGQTAPGDGITLRNHGIAVKAGNVIIRYLRVRPGDQSGTETDAISVFKGTDIIIDHCSTSWATDETLSISPSKRESMRAIDNVTVQWSIISESLNRSVHHKGDHGYGTLLRGSDGARYSMHHNLWAHHSARMPRPGNYIPIDEDPVGPMIDIRNNVFYNWGGKRSGYNADTESISSYNFVANYYLAGPNSTGNIAFNESSPYAKMFFHGNWMNGGGVNDPLSVVRLPQGRALYEREHAHLSTETANADDVFTDVLDGAGASRVRDSVDRRIVSEVRQGIGRIIDRPQDVGGWPQHESLPAPSDGDGDGMPDAWESSRGLDPNDADDGPVDPDGDGYTNLEDYLNSLAF